MRIVLASVACVALASTGSARGASAQERRLTREDVAGLARERAPEVVLARGRIDEARAERAGASALLDENPSLSGTAGPRWTRDGTLPQVEVGIEQSFALGGGRGARLDAVRAAVDRTRADAADVARASVAEALSAFVGALDAQARVDLAGQSERVAADLVRIAERREAAGDVSVLDVHLARAAVLRARSARQAAEAEGRAIRASLAALLALDGDVAVDGDLTDAPPYRLPDLVATASRRPALAALRAEMREADARLREGEAAALPRLTLGVSYEYDAGDDLALGTVGLALPLFDRGAGERSVARARRRTAGAALAATARATRIELAGLHRSYEAHRAALAVAAEAVAALSETEPLLLRAYDAGETALTEVLSLRRELLDARGEKLDRARDLALARIRLEATAGVLR